MLVANLIEIIIRANNLASDQIKSITGSLDSMGNSAIKVGGALTAITAPISIFLGTALKAASEEQTVFGQLDAVLRSTAGAAGWTADEAKNLASELQGVTRYGNVAVLSAENMLLTFTSIGREIFPQVTETALDMSTALGQDLKSSAIQLGKALNDPITGVTALRRVGVQFTDSQMEMIKSLVESNDLLGAQTMILNELQKEFGGSAKAAGETFAGKLDILKNKFEDLQKKIAYIFMPTLGALFDKIGNVVDNISKWVDANPKLTKIIVAFGAALAALGPILIAVGGAMKVIAVLAPVIGTVIGALTSPVALVVGGVALLAKILNIDLVKGFGRLIESIGWFVDDIGNLGLVDAIRKALASPFNSWVEGVLVGFGMARKDAENLVQSWARSFEKFAPILQIITDKIDYFVKEIPVLLAQIPFYAGYYFGKIWSVVEPLLQPLIDWFTGTGDNSLSGAISSVATWIDEYVVAPLIGIWRVAGPLLQPILDFFSENIPRVITEAQRVFGLVGDTLNTLWNNARPYLEPMITWFRNAADTIKGFFQPILDFIKGIMNKAADTWEMIRRIGGGTPMRTLPGEIAPGVSGGMAGNGSGGNSSGFGYAPSNGIGNAAYQAGQFVGNAIQTISASAQGYNYAAGILPSSFTGTAFPTRDAYGPGVAGKTYMIGRGVQPELFTPSTNGQFSSGKGGNTYIVEQHIPPNSSINISKEEMQDMLRQAVWELIDHNA